MFFKHRGWSTKFVQSKLFILKRVENFDKEEEEDSNIQNQNSLIKNFINNLLEDDNNNTNSHYESDKEFLIENSILTNESISNNQTDLNSQTLNINYDYFSKDSLEKQNFQETLIKYFIFSCHQHSIFLNSLFFKTEEDSLTHICLGNINLIGNYFKYKYTNYQNLVYSTAMSIKYHYEYSRYEYLFISQILRVLIVGNKQGDIQIYDLELIVNNEGKITINDSPIAIIDCNGRLAGFKVIEYENSYGLNHLEIYILKINKNLECYKFRRNEI
jgi:hypothetical protein